MGNYVSRFIAEALFSQGLSSSFVHLFISTLHFPHADMADVYRLRVQDWIRGNVTKCAASLFVFNELGGLHHSSLIDSSLIDVFLPFLPLERKHVRLCVEREAGRRNITLTAEQVGEVADSLVYWPKETQLFSTTGCKRVANKLDLLEEAMEEEEI